MRDKRLEIKFSKREMVVLDDKRGGMSRAEFLRVLVERCDVAVVVRAGEVVKGSKMREYNRVLRKVAGMSEEERAKQVRGVLGDKRVSETAKVKRVKRDMGTVEGRVDKRTPLERSLGVG